jgi:23S rRNA (uracil1939-C5)-methyltransferase
MVILVINGKGIPNAAKLIQMLDDAIFEVPVYEEGPLAGVEFSLESVVVNVNKKNTSDILGEECITLAGSPTIMEKVGDLEFEISPLSFYQVNPQQMEKLYGKVVEYADLKGGETVLDLYCGVGSIGLFLADDMRKKGDSAGRVIGIESVKPAVVDANRNAVVNGIVNARYVCGKAEEEMPKMVSGEGLKDESLRITQADVVILDPPRAGCEEELLKAVVDVDQSKIVYVSWDPATLARDLKFLTANGYEFVEATPCDMFPWTGHCEVVTLLVKAN